MIIGPKICTPNITKQNWTKLVLPAPPVLQHSISEPHEPFELWSCHFEWFQLLAFVFLGRGKNNAVRVVLLALLNVRFWTASAGYLGCQSWVIGGIIHYPERNGPGYQAAFRANVQDVPTDASHAHPLLMWRWCPLSFPIRHSCPLVSLVSPVLDRGISFPVGSFGCTASLQKRRHAPAHYLSTALAASQGNLCNSW